MNMMFNFFNKSLITYIKKKKKVDALVVIDTWLRLLST